MDLLLVGRGATTSRLNMLFTERGHTVTAVLASLELNHLDLFDYEAVIVVSPEASVMQETLTRVTERHRFVLLIAGSGDGLAAWGASAATAVYAYPLNDYDTSQLLEKMGQLESGGVSKDDLYRRQLGADIAARIQSNMAIRKIVITSPKGGTGKTTIAVNLAVALAHCGVTTYLVDADANAGALQYHLRLFEVRNTLFTLLNKAVARAKVDTPMGAAASAGAYMDAFTEIRELPTLKVLPGLVADNLGAESLQNIENIEETIKGLYEAGAAAGGVVVMDVGINPSHPVHRAALRYAEAISIVIKPEVPDLAETRRWIKKMIDSLTLATTRATATEFIGSRVKLCYNQVDLTKIDRLKRIQNLLQSALKDDKVDISIVPNGIIPHVNSDAALDAVNSDRIEDVLVWRYKNQKLEELEAFSQAVVSFGSHFVPVLKEAAVRAGLERAHNEQKRGLFGRKGRK